MFSLITSTLLQTSLLFPWWSRQPIRCFSFPLALLFQAHLMHGLGGLQWRKLEKYTPYTRSSKIVLFLSNVASKCPVVALEWHRDLPLQGALTDFSQKSCSANDRSDFLSGKSISAWQSGHRNLPCFWFTLVWKHDIAWYSLGIETNRASNLFLETRKERIHNDRLKL